MLKINESAGLECVEYEFLKSIFATTLHHSAPANKVRAISVTFLSLQLDETKAIALFPIAVSCFLIV